MSSAARAPCIVLFNSCCFALMPGLCLRLRPCQCLCSYSPHRPLTMMLGGIPFLAELRKDRGHVLQLCDGGSSRGGAGQVPLLWREGLCMRRAPPIGNRAVRAANWRDRPLLPATEGWWRTRQCDGARSGQRQAQSLDVQQAQGRTSSATPCRLRCRCAGSSCLGDRVDAYRVQCGLDCDVCVHREELLREARGDGYPP